MKSNINLTLLGSGPFFETIRHALAAEFNFKSEKPDLFIVANYGRKISKKELAAAKYVNVHASLLPKLKGPTPIQTAILNGLAETGFSLIEMDEKIDHGPIIAQGRVKISSRDDFATLSAKIANAGAEALIQIIPKNLSGGIKPQRQNHRDETWTKKIEDRDRIISREELKKNPQSAERRVRALFPKPKAYLELGAKRLIIHQAKINNHQFRPLVVQLEGKKPIAWQEFTRGWRGKLPPTLDV